MPHPDKIFVDSNYGRFTCHREHSASLGEKPLYRIEIPMVGGHGMSALVTEETRYIIIEKNGESLADVIAEEHVKDLLLDPLKKAIEKMGKMTDSTPHWLQEQRKHKFTNRRR